MFAMNITRIIDCMSQDNSNNNWVISFSDMFKANILHGLEVKFINELARIESVDEKIVN